MEKLIMSARASGCSDIHLSQGLPLMLRIHGQLEPAPFSLTDAECRDLILSVLDEGQRKRLEAGEGDLDFSLRTEDGCRQRVNVFRQRQGLAATIRLLSDHIPDLASLGLPKVLADLAELPRGLVLITGPTGSGKSTTLAAMIDHINRTRSEHIITIEDPVEYVYPQGKSLIHQREVGRDTGDFAAALRSALREDPDVILVGEMRDYETVAAALTAAETGHLVLSTLHTTGAAQTVDRIIDACPGGIQAQVRTQLAMVLEGVVTQCLIPTLDGTGRVAATEIMLGTEAVGNLIRENKCHQISTLLQAGGALGMHTLNSDLTRLARTMRISWENAERYSNDKRELEQHRGI